MTARRSATALAVLGLACAALAAAPEPEAVRAVRGTDGERVVAPFVPAPPEGIRSWGERPMRIEPPRDGSVVPAAADEPAAGRSADGVSYRLSGLPMVGRVTAFALSPAGTRAVYVADQETANRFELYSTPLDGSATPVKLSAALGFGSGDQGVSAFEITPDGAHVVFLADPTAGGGIGDLYSVPIDGSAAAVRLSSGSERPVTGFGIAPGGVHVAFLAPAPNGAVELYAASVGVAASSRQISDAGATNPQGDAAAALFSPDGTRVVYAADATSDGVFQWHSVPITASAPGSDVQLSGALGFVNLAAITPDGGRVVYTSDGLILGRFELFSVPIAGGVRIRLNPSMAGDGVRAIAIDPSGQRVGYIADQDTAGVPEVYGALVATAGSGRRLSVPMGGTQSADALATAPDAATLLYEADQDTAGTFELFRVALAGGESPAMLHDVTAPANVGWFDGVGLPILGRRALYPVLGSPVELYSVPFDGSEAQMKVSGPLATGDTVRDAFVPARVTRLYAYGTGSASGARTVAVHAAAVRGDLPIEQFNVTAGSSANGVLAYRIDPLERYGVYLQDQATSGKPELWARPLDSDADTVENRTDNCPFVANATQDPVPFGAAVLGEAGGRFAWGAPSDVRWVRGPLSGVPTLAVDASGTLIEATAYTDAIVPAAGAGFYYLFAPDCAGRTWQTAPGAEPERDLALP